MRKYNLFIVIVGFYFVGIVQNTYNLDWWFSVLVGIAGIEFARYLDKKMKE